MDILKSHIKTQSPEFQRNRSYHQGLAEDLRRRLKAVANAVSPQTVGLALSASLNAPLTRGLAPVYRM